MAGTLMHSFLTIGTFWHNIHLGFPRAFIGIYRTTHVTLSFVKGWIV